MPAVSLTDLKKFLNITSATNDDELLDMIDRAEAILSRRVGPLTPTVVANEPHIGPGPLLLRRWPVTSVESVTSGGLTAAGWTADVAAGTVSAPYVPYGASVQVNYTAGRAAPLPLDLEAAVLEMVAHLWRSQRVPGATRAATFGQQSEQDMQVGQGFLLPYRVQTLIEPHVLPAIA